MRGKHYWLLGTGITVFLIGSYMFISWMVGLCIISCTQEFFKLGDFTLEKFVHGTYRFYACPPSYSSFGDPSQCFSDLFNGDGRTFYHGLVWSVWLTGLFLIIFSAGKLISARPSIVRREFSD